MGPQQVDRRAWAEQIAALPPEQKAAWKAWLLRRHPIWQPLPGPQTHALHTKADYLFYGGAAGGGKALALDTPLRTPTGWTTMGAVRAGDQLLDEQGRPCAVVATSPVMYGRRVYEVLFDDGARIRADAEHLWLTRATATALRTTAEIAATVSAGHAIDGPGRLIRRVIAVRETTSVPVKCIAVDSPSHLYLVGRSLIPTHNSDLLLGLALTQHRKSVIYRREYPQFRDLVFRSQELLAGAAGTRYNGQSMVWRGLPGDRILEFGAVAHDGDLGRWKGRPHDLCAFDEVSDVSEFQFRFLTGWARTTYPNQRVRIVAAGNPPTTAEGEWVVRFWAPWLDDQYPRPAKPGELRWFTYLDNKDVEVEGSTPFEHKGEIITPKSRTFLPARVTDNMFLLASGYLSQLQSLPEPLRSQLIFGDFGMKLDDDPWQVIPTAWVLAAQKRWREIKERGDDIGPLSCLGVDIARGGKDKTCIAPRHGTFVDEVQTYPGASTPDGPAAATLIEQALALRAGGNLYGVQLNIDVIGVGASVYDIVKDAHPYFTWGVNFAEAPFVPLYDRSGRLRLPNYRSVAYWKLREMLDPATGDNLALPDDRELRADLCAARWSLRPSGIAIEDKETLSARLGRSPDKGDAVALCLLPPPITGPVTATENPFYED